jgi:hypothetical protein
MDKTPTQIEMDKLTNEIKYLRLTEDVKEVELTNEGRATLLHEIQHAIQQKENWAKGGNKNNLNPKDLAETLKLQYGDLPAFNKIENDYLDSIIETEDEMYSKIINIAKISSNYTSFRIRLFLNTSYMPKLNTIYLILINKSITIKLVIIIRHTYIKTFPKIIRELFFLINKIH